MGAGILAFLLGPIGRYIALGVAVVALLGGLYFYIDHSARVAERNAIAAKAAEQREKDRKDREKNDEKVRDLDDDAALKCLRNPTGC